GRGILAGSNARSTGMDLETDPGRMEVIRGGTHPPPFGAPGTGGAIGPQPIDLSLPTPPRNNRDAEIASLQDRISKLEALIQRDEDVLRKVLALLVEKGVATREEILERLR